MKTPEEVRQALPSCIEIINIFNNLDLGSGILYFEPLGAFYLINEFLPAELGVSQLNNAVGIDVTPYILDHISLTHSTQSIEGKITNAIKMLQRSDLKKIDLSWPTNDKSGFFIWFKKG